MASRNARGRRIFDSPFICLHCEKVMHEMRDMSHHRGEHSSFKMYCSCCGEIYSTAAELSRHLNQKGAHKRPMCAAGLNKIGELSQKKNDINELVDEIFQAINIPTISFLNEGDMAQTLNIYVDPVAEVNNIVAVADVDVENVAVVNDVVAVDDVGAGNVAEVNNVVAYYGNVEGNVAQGDDVIKLREENRAMREKLYRINAEKLYWKRSAKRMRTMVHWTTGLLYNQGENLDDSEDKREFRRKLNGTEVVPGEGKMGGSSNPGIHGENA